MSAEEMYTPEQVAKLLQIDVTTVYRWIREGRLPTSKLGKSYRMVKEDVEQLLTRTTTSKAATRRFFERVAKIAERNRSVPFEDVERDVGEAVRAVRKPARR